MDPHLARIDNSFPVTGTASGMWEALHAGQGNGIGTSVGFTFNQTSLVCRDGRGASFWLHTAPLARPGFPGLLPGALVTERSHEI